MARVVTSLSWDPGLLRQVDRVAKQRNVSRSRLLEDVLSSSPEFRKVVSASVVAGLQFGFMGMMYLVTWAVMTNPVIS